MEEHDRARDEGECLNIEAVGISKPHPDGHASPVDEDVAVQELRVQVHEKLLLFECSDC